MKVGDQLPESLSDAIEESAYALIIISEHSQESPWVQLELNKALKRMAEGACKVLPVLVGTADAPNFLESLVYADFRKSFQHGLNAIVGSIDKAEYVHDLAPKTRLEKFVVEVFGSIGNSLIIGAGYLNAPDFDIITIDDSRHAVLEVIDEDHYKWDGNLGIEWWLAYNDHAQRWVSEPAVLIVTDRSVRLPIFTRIHTGIWMTRMKTECFLPGQKDPGNCVVLVVSITKKMRKTSALSRLETAKAALFRSTSKPLG